MVLDVQEKKLNVVRNVLTSFFFVKMCNNKYGQCSNQTSWLATTTDTMISCLSGLSGNCSALVSQGHNPRSLVNKWKTIYFTKGDF